MSISRTRWPGQSSAAGPAKLLQYALSNLEEKFPPESVFPLWNRPLSWR
jgi:hypothetical protein